MGAAPAHIILPVALDGWGRKKGKGRKPHLAQPPLSVCPGARGSRRLVFRRVAADQHGSYSGRHPRIRTAKRETASLVKAYYQVAPERRRAIHRLIKAITETQPD